jgi:hypothetical protein
VFDDVPGFTHVPCVLSHWCIPLAQGWAGVGVLVGESDGAAVGVLVGDSVGTGEGASVGAGVGDTVGAAVG